MYTVEAETQKQAKDIALDNQADWERIDDFFNHEPPIVTEIIAEKYNPLEEYTTPKFEPPEESYECPKCGYDDLPNDTVDCPKCK